MPRHIPSRVKIEEFENDPVLEDIKTMDLTEETLSKEKKKSRIIEAILIIILIIIAVLYIAARLRL
jgi:hypothetical protein